MTCQHCGKEGASEVFRAGTYLCVPDCLGHDPFDIEPADCDGTCKDCGYTTDHASTEFECPQCGGQIALDPD
jgi:Zn finger protein HypA/HybF involved in hydrogenase expression